MILKRIALITLLVILGACACEAQTTAVTGTVADANGNAYFPGTVSAAIVLNSGQALPAGVPASGSIGPVATTSGGNFSVVVASPFSWVFTICGTPVSLGPRGNPTPTQTCFSTAPIAISGASQVLTAGQLGTIPLLGPSGGSGISSVSARQIDPTQAPYNVKADAFIGADGVSSNGSTTFTSASRACNVVDNGKLVIVVAGGNYPHGTGLVTQTGCSGNSYILSVAGNGNSASGETWAIGTDANPVGNPGLSNAWSDALTANPGKTLVLPCGAMIYSTAPFTNVNSVSTFASQRANLNGCNATDGTTFIIHPNVLVQLPSGGTIFAFSPGSATGYNPGNGINRNQGISNILLTSLGGLLPKTSGQAYTFISSSTWGLFKNITGHSIGMASNSGGVTFIATNGEALVDGLNFQQTSGSGFSWSVVGFSGQGANTISNSVIAFTTGIAVTCSGQSDCNIENLYTNTFTGTAVLVNGAGPARVKITGSCITAAQGASSTAAISDGANQTTFYVFANGLAASNCSGISGSAQAGFNLANANSILDASGTDITGSAGNPVIGIGTINDRAGNSFSSPLTNFTGKYVPIGGGSVANNTASTATNFGAVLTNVNMLGGVSPANATYDVKIGFRQVTLGVGCGAGSNTVNAVMTWTAGGISQSTGSGGVPAIPTLTIAANGAVGSSSAYISQAVHIDMNTQVTFTTTSTLASAGCSTVPQYVVDYSNI
jgi:hypothetical protein